MNERKKGKSERKTTIVKDIKKYHGTGKKKGRKKEKKALLAQVGLSKELMRLWWYHL